MGIGTREGGAHSLCFAAFCGFDFELHALAAGIARQDFGAEFELHALLFQYLFRGLGNLGVHAWTSDLAEEFDDCDFSA